MCEVEEILPILHYNFFSLHLLKDMFLKYIMPVKLITTKIKSRKYTLRQ